MIRKSLILRGILILTALVSTVGWSNEKVQPPELTKLGVKELLQKHQKDRKSRTETPALTLPKIPILGESMVNPNRTRVYLPYLPYNYGYGYNPWFYGPDSYRQPERPPIVLFNEELDMALMWDERWQHFKWEPIVPPRVYNNPPVILTNQAPRERVITKPAEESIKVSKGEILFLEKKAESQKITIRVEGEDFTYPLAEDIVVLRGAKDEKATEAFLKELCPSDQAELRFSNDGKVNLIRATYKLLQGKVAAIAQSTVLLESGETFKITPGARILLPGKIEGKVEDVKTSYFIQAQIGPISGNACRIEIVSKDKTKD